MGEGTNHLRHILLPQTIHLANFDVLDNETCPLRSVFSSFLPPQGDEGINLLNPVLRRKAVTRKNGFLAPLRLDSQLFGAPAFTQSVSRRISSAVNFGPRLGIFPSAERVTNKLREASPGVITLPFLEPAISAS